jgi:hypothetical protein
MASPIRPARARNGLLGAALGVLATLVALACTFPLAVSVPLPDQPPPHFWWTPTPNPLFTPQAVLDAAPITQTTSEPQDEAPAPTPTASISIPTPDPTEAAPILYYAQAGDTLPVVAVRFGVSLDEITSPEPLPPTRMINPNQLLIIPQRLSNTTSSQHVLADSELIYSPSGTDFDVNAFVAETGGYLSEYEEYLATTNTTSGAEVVERIATENSINPRLLLALLEYQSHWVLGDETDLNFAQRDYPMGVIDVKRKGLYRQLAWAVNQLSIGYYGWREGLLTEIIFKDGAVARLAPDLNAGTVALQYYFAQHFDAAEWVGAMDLETGFPALYEEMFGNPWVRALTVEPLFPPELEQPRLILPFLYGQLWSFTGGPHGAWERDGARAALDFAPSSTQSGCVESNQIAAAAAPGLVVRSGNGLVVIDLDGDGLEQTGWNLLYLHVTDNGHAPLAPVGTWLETGDWLGYPSCEGGLATGTHIHIARKYNGEWIPADGPLPFVLDGWVASAGGAPYEGTLHKDGRTIVASPLGTFGTRIMRERPAE